MNDTQTLSMHAVVYECIEQTIIQIPCELLRSYMHAQLIDPVWIDINRMVCNQIILEITQDARNGLVT